MNIYKIFLHIKIRLKIIFLKILYRNRIEIGKGISFRRGLSVFIEKKGKVRIGENCFFNNYCSINSHLNIKIGDNCIFGEGVKIYDHNHIFINKEIPIANQGFNIATVKVGNNCWIGSNVIILKGVEIGDNVVIGSGCLIYKNIPSNTVVKNKVSMICEARN